VRQRNTTPWARSAETAFIGVLLPQHTDSRAVALVALILGSPTLLLLEVTALGTTKMREAMQGTNALRTTGTAHLLAAARAVGAHRFLTQSNVFGYGSRDHGPHTISEDDPLAEPESGPL
jgi:nucleoside-diphosphate-sugar epimerase